MTDTIDRDTISEVMYQADLEDDQLRDDYSGRGMYGDTCFGIVTHDIGFARFMAHLGSQDIDLAEKLLRKLTTDNMGRETIYYFRGLTLSD